MTIDLIRRLRKIATLESEDYGAEPQDHSSWQAADLIERQAAQIEMMREVLKHPFVNWIWHKNGDTYTQKETDFPQHMSGVFLDAVDGALAITPDQALEQFATKVREQCAQMLLNGSFLHDQAPDKLLAAEAAKAIRAIKELP